MVGKKTVHFTSKPTNSNPIKAEMLIQKLTPIVAITNVQDNKEIVAVANDDDGYLN